ncbi:MAG: 5'/3'-nucleotidase SurE [Deltaproteobacteria bacterium]|nr:5'/3'-nucleotidase SurE [Deltaproteobacteria bacterium]
MRVLLTNDDGIFSKGIEALYFALSQEHEVTVVAPETEQSAVGHAITWLDPLKVIPIQRNGSFFGYALSGTPADCAKIGILELMKPPPDVVVSGINMGANVGVNVIYSGTVSAATEAALLGVPSVAVSIDSFKTTDFSAATRFIPRLLRVLQEKKLPRGVSLNVNVPNIPWEEVRGVKITHQGRLQCVESYDRRMDPRMHVYYWLTNTDILHDPDPDADSTAISDHYISVTPIHHDLTRHDILQEMREWKLP